jgi:hypothetical protein
MLRFSSLLVVVLLAVPAVRDCCLPPAQVLTCHGTGPGQDQSCTLTEGAVIPVNGSEAAAFIAEFLFPIMTDTDEFYRLTSLSGEIPLPRPFISDVNLRTGTLLI